MEFGFTQPPMSSQLFSSSSRLAGCRARKAPNARSGTASSAWRWRWLPPLSARRRDFGLSLSDRGGGAIGYLLATARADDRDATTCGRDALASSVWRRSLSASTRISKLGESLAWRCARTRLDGFAALWPRKTASRSRSCGSKCSSASSSARSPSPARSWPMANLRASVNCAAKKLPGRAHAESQALRICRCLADLYFNRAGSGRWFLMTLAALSSAII